jgi:hypothetical protein
MVPGYRRGRTESNRDRLERLVRRRAQAIPQSAKAREKLAAGFILLQPARKGVVETVEGFIRGAEHNGIVHRTKEGKEYASRCKLSRNIPAL